MKIPTVVAVCACVSLLADTVAAVPDPCGLITVAELSLIVGPLTGKPKPGDVKAGDVSCEYAPAKEPAWIELRLNEGDLGYWKKRNGGPNPVPAPEFGTGAFMNLDADGTTDLFVTKGGLVLRVSMPRGPKTADHVKAIARKALPRL